MSAPRLSRDQRSGGSLPLAAGRREEGQEVKDGTYPCPAHDSCLVTEDNFWTWYNLQADSIDQLVIEKKEKTLILETVDISCGWLLLYWEEYLQACH